MAATAKIACEVIRTIISVSFREKPLKQLFAEEFMLTHAASVILIIGNDF